MDQQPFQKNLLGGRSIRMEYASLILGIIGIVGCTCFYLSIPCAAMAIVFATLSRGEEMQYSTRSLVGLVLGIVALILIITFYGTSFLVAWKQYGSIEGILKAYAQNNGIDYDEIFKLME